MAFLCHRTISLLSKILVHVILVTIMVSLQFHRENFGFNTVVRSYMKYYFDYSAHLILAQLDFSNTKPFNLRNINFNTVPKSNFSQNLLNIDFGSMKFSGKLPKSNGLGLVVIHCSFIIHFGRIFLKTRVFNGMCYTIL